MAQQFPGLENISNDILRGRDKVGIVSDDQFLTELFGEVLDAQNLKLKSFQLESIAEGEPQNFYVVDLQGFDSYQNVVNQIHNIRELRPDSELILLHTPDTVIRPQSQLLNDPIDMHLVPVYTRPSSQGTVKYEKELQKFIISELSNHIVQYLSLPSLLKVGGSLLDNYNSNPDALPAFLEEVLRLHDNAYPIIICNGGGPLKDRLNEVGSAYGARDNTLRALKDISNIIVGLIGPKAEYTSPSKMRNTIFTPEYLRDHIPVVPSSGRSGIPLAESDTHTLMIGEAQGLSLAYFAKDTDGIWKYDPHRDSPRVKGKIGPLPITIGEENKFYGQIYAGEVVNGTINRRGPEGSGEHIADSGSLNILRGSASRDQTRHIRGIRVFNGMDSSLLGPVLNGEYRDGSHIGSIISRGYRALQR